MLPFQEFNEYVISGLLGIIAWQNGKLRPFLMQNKEVLTRLEKFLKKVNIFD